MRFLRTYGLMCGLICSLITQAVSASKGNDFDWTIVENSPVILTGKLTMKGEKRATNDITTFNLNSPRIIKGKLDGYYEGKSYSISYLADETEFRAVKNKEGQEVIIFALPCYNNVGKPCLIYEPSYSIFIANRGRLKAINHLSEENDFLFKKSLDKCDKIKNRAELDRLIARLDESKSDQKFALDQLVEMGPAIVPYLICRMPHEFKPFRMRSLIVENHGSNSFEQYAMYSPALKVDVLDFILSEITGVQFTPLTNGGTDKDREQTIRGWMIYLQRNFPDI